MKNYIKGTLNTHFNANRITIEVTISELDQLISQKRLSRNKTTYLSLSDNVKINILNEWISYKKIVQKRKEDYIELKEVIKNTLINNRDVKVGTLILKPIVLLLEDNLYRKYQNVQNRMKIYKIIRELRKDYQSAGWESYIVSGAVIATSNIDEHNDGWMLTSDRDKILNYLNSNIDKAETMRNGFESLKQSFENTSER